MSTHNNSVDLFSLTTDDVEGGIPRQSGGIENKKVPGSFEFSGTFFYSFGALSLCLFVPVVASALGYQDSIIFNFVYDSIAII